MDPEPIAAVLRQSRKYGGLCPDTLGRVAAWAVARSRTPKEATQRARRKLHQVYGAYLADWDGAAAEAALDQWSGAARGQALKDVCRRILSLHASTAERLPLLDRIYDDLFAVTGRPRSVLDLGCGLHPFALPWMDLPPGARYEAWDIDQQMVGLAGRFLALAGVEGAALCRDVLVTPPTAAADVAFLLKTAPCLEQQVQGSVSGLLASINARFVVLSFPTSSLGGRARGMRLNYGRIAEGWLAGLGMRAGKLDYPQETFYVVETRRTTASEHPLG